MGARWTLDTTVMDRIISNDAQRDRFIRGVGIEMVGDMQMSMTESPATGKRYGDHIASSPGFPPRVDEGILRASIKLEKIRSKSYAITTDVLHGLETEIGIGMDARPWMRPVFIIWGDKLPYEAQRFFDWELPF